MRIRYFVGLAAALLATCGSVRAWADESERSICQQTRILGGHWNPALAQMNGAWTDGSGTGLVLIYFSPEVSFLVLPGLITTTIQTAILAENLKNDRVSMKGWNITPVANISGMLPPITPAQIEELRALGDATLTSDLSRLNLQAPDDRYEYFQNRKRILRDVIKSKTRSIEDQLKEPPTNEDEKAYKDQIIAKYREEAEENTRVLKGIESILSEIAANDPSMDTSPQHVTFEMTLQRRWKPDGTFQLTLVLETGDIVPLGYVRDLLPNEVNGLKSASAGVREHCGKYANVPAPSGPAAAKSQTEVPDSDRPPGAAQPRSTETQPKADRRITF